MSTTTAFPLAFDTTPSSERRAEAEREAILADPGFGKHFTDHMVTISWSAQQGWHDAVVKPYGPLQLDPAASVLHYAQEIFEGLKAYRWADGSVWAFRPEANAERLQRSARRLSLPELPEADFLSAIEHLVKIDQEWVPSAPETSLYLRPFMFANEAFLPMASVAGTSPWAVFDVLPAMDGSWKGSIAFSLTPSAIFTTKQCMYRSALRRKRRKEERPRVSTVLGAREAREGEPGVNLHKRVKEWALLSRGCRSLPTSRTHIYPYSEPVPPAHYDQNPEAISR